MATNVWMYSRCKDLYGRSLAGRKNEDTSLHRDDHSGHLHPANARPGGNWRGSEAMPPCAAEIARRIRVVAKTTDLFHTIGFPPPAREKVAGMIEESRRCVVAAGTVKKTGMDGCMAGWVETACKINDQSKLALDPTNNSKFLCF